MIKVCGSVPGSIHKVSQGQLALLTQGLSGNTSAAPAWALRSCSSLCCCATHQPHHLVPPGTTQHRLASPWPVCPFTTRYHLVPPNTAWHHPAPPNTTWHHHAYVPMHNLHPLVSPGTTQHSLAQPNTTQHRLASPCLCAHAATAPLGNTWRHPAQPGTPKASGPLQQLHTLVSPVQ